MYSVIITKRGRFRARWLTGTTKNIFMQILSDYNTARTGVHIMKEYKVVAIHGRKPGARMAQQRYRHQSDLEEFQLYRPLVCLDFVRADMQYLQNNRSIHLLHATAIYPSTSFDSRRGSVGPKVAISDRYSDSNARIPRLPHLHCRDNSGNVPQHCLQTRDV